MLAIDAALTLLRKYNFNSTTSFPYLFSSDDKVGLVYSYYDDEYGTLQRAKFFEDEEILEEFLKRYRWYLDNGEKNNVRMILDDYEIVDPHVLFLRNNLPMIKGEMFDLETFRVRESQVNSLEPVARTIYEAGNLLLTYDSIKAKQLKYFENAKNVNNQLRQLYYNLQKEVDMYNGKIVDRDLILQKQTAVNPGINELMENSVKDRYNQYRISPPTIEEADALVKEVWDLLSSMELDATIYNIEANINNIRGEIDVVSKKFNLVKSLNQSEDKFHKINLIKSFREINKQSEASSIILDSSYVKKRVESISRKYSYIDILDPNNLDNYIKECSFNNNYDAVALKYQKNSRINGKEDISINALATDIFNQYKANLSVDNHAMLILYNSIYRQLFDLVFNIPDFMLKSNEEILGILNKTKGINKVKSECFEKVKKGFLNLDNQKIQGQFFESVNFDTFDSFLLSMIAKIKTLKNSNKIYANGNVKLFFLVRNIDEMYTKKFLVVTNDINSLKAQITSPNNLIGVATLYKGTPLLYAPYGVDFDLDHARDAQQAFKIIETGKLEILLDMNEVNCYLDNTISHINEYVSNPTLVNDVSVVTQVALTNKLNFFKVSFSMKEVQAVTNANQASSTMNANDSFSDNANERIDEEEIKVEIKMSDNPYDEDEFPKVKENETETNDGGSE